MAVARHKYSLVEYFAWEAIKRIATSSIGEVYATAGGRRGHAPIVANLVRHLGMTSTARLAKSSAKA
jgi:hypothetical protein